MDIIDEATAKKQFADLLLKIQDDVMGSREDGRELTDLKQRGIGAGLAAAIGAILDSGYKIVEMATLAPIQAITKEELISSIVVLQKLSQEIDGGVISPKTKSALLETINNFQIKLRKFKQSANDSIISPEGSEQLKEIIPLGGYMADEPAIIKAKTATNFTDEEMRTFLRNQCTGDVFNVWAVPPPMNADIITKAEESKPEIHHHDVGDIQGFPNLDAEGNVLIDRSKALDALEKDLSGIIPPESIAALKETISKLKSRVKVNNLNTVIGRGQTDGTLVVPENLTLEQLQEYAENRDYSRSKPTSETAICVAEHDRGMARERFISDGSPDQENLMRSIGTTLGLSNAMAAIKNLAQVAGEEVKTEDPTHSPVTQIVDTWVGVGSSLGGIQSEPLSSSKRSMDAARGVNSPIGQIDEDWSATGSFGDASAVVPREGFIITGSNGGHVVAVVELDAFDPIYEGQDAGQCIPSDDINAVALEESSYPDRDGDLGQSVDSE